MVSGCLGGAVSLSPRRISTCVQLRCLPERWTFCGLRGVGTCVGGAPPRGALSLLFGRVFHGA